MERRQYIALLSAAALAFISLSALALSLFVFSERSDTSIAAHAQQVLTRCADAQHRPTCYNREIPKLMDVLKLSEAFDVTRIVQQYDTAFNYCHVLGHELGEREVANDPGNWMHVVTQCPADGMCANGCLHGALVARFSADALTDAEIEAALPDLSVACERRDGFDPSQLDQAVCYHGLGHLAVYMTGADIPDALAICDRLGKKTDGRDLRNVCYEGAFMQIFQPLEPEDEALTEDISVTKANARDFCDRFGTPAKQAACWREAWPLFRSTAQTPEGVVAFCEQTRHTEYRAQCLNMLFYTIGQGNHFNTAETSEFCAAVQTPHQAMCYAANAKAMVQAEPELASRAAALCDRAQGDARAACFRELDAYAAYRFTAGSAAFARLCERIPETFQRTCYSTGVAN